jgi:hypothetical protein
VLDVDGCRHVLDAHIGIHCENAWQAERIVIGNEGRMALVFKNKQ